MSDPKAANTKRLNAMVDNLRKRGVSLPRNAARAKVEALSIHKMAGANAGSSQRYGFLDTSANSEAAADDIQQNTRIINSMKRQRTASSMRRQSNIGTGGGGDVFAAMPRFYDPLEYWDITGLPWNMADEGHRHKLHKWLRLYYATHYLVPILIDIFTRFPLSGMEIKCFAGDTKILTKEGVQAIGDLSWSSDTEILNGDGHWQSCPVFHCGEQTIWELTVRQNGRDRVIKTTKDHRWFTEKGAELTTDELTTGTKLKTVKPMNIVKCGGHTRPSALGIIRGFVLGDGTLAHSGGGSFVDLHGEKDQQLLKYFPDPVIRSYEDRTRVAQLPAYFKTEYPSLEEGTAYLYGWLAGYFAADGTVSKRGEVYLDSVDRDHLEYARDVCLRLGITTREIYEYTTDKVTPQGAEYKDWTGLRLAIDAYSLTEEFFLIDQHRSRWLEVEARKPVRRDGWTVVSVDETKVKESVYCTVVEGTESFVLDGYILTGNCKDKQATKFYEELFLNDLNYPEFFVGLGREHFLIGEAFPLASFDDTLGIWEREELLNPEDIIIENFPLLGSRQLKIVPPDYLKKLAQTKQPAREYRMLEMNFPELIPYLRKNEHIPISDVLLKQVSNKFTSWDDHGTPMLLRGLRTLIHEEKLLASQDAIAERLYSPLILAKMGITDLGDGQGPWFPSPDELDALRDDMDVALSSDFRLLVHHMGLDITNVFGREQMPRLGDDFDRIERRLMQIFGINPSLLSAGANSQPYASSALQAEFMNQVLRTYQGHLKRHFLERAMVVAEAQGHYDYETRGDTRVPIMEEVVIEDEDGNKRVEERHKLIDVELDFSVLDLRDEATERQFFQALRQQGVPIPDEKLMLGVNIDFDEMVVQYNEDLEKKTIAQQAAKVKTYNALAAAGLPIPPDLKAEVEASRNGGAAPPGGPPPGGPPPGGMPGMPPGGGMGPHGGPGSPIVMPGMPGGMGAPGGPPGSPGALGPGGVGGATPGGGAPPRGGMQPGPAGIVPDISNERRPGLNYGGSVKSDLEDSTDGDFEVTCPHCGESHCDCGTKELHKQVKAVTVPVDDSVTGMRPHEAREDDTVVRLPRASNKRKYRLLDED